MKKIIIFFCFLLNLVIYSQEKKEAVYFERFFNTNYLFSGNGYFGDSLKLSVKMSKEKTKKKMQIFKITFNNDKEDVNFRIGIKDSICYSLKGNKKYELVSFKSKVKTENKEVYFHPFSTKDKVNFSNELLYNYYGRLFVFSLISKRDSSNYLFKDIILKNIYLSTNSGIFIIVYDFKTNSYFSSNIGK